MKGPRDEREAAQMLVWTDSDAPGSMIVLLTGILAHLA